MQGFTRYLFGLAVAGCGAVGTRPSDAAAAADAAGGDAPTCVPSPAGLQARWRGEMNAVDDTGAHDGTLTSPQFTPSGHHGSAFLFDGIRSVLMADPEDTLWPPGSFSVEAWVKADIAPTETAKVVEKYSCGGTGGCDGSEYTLQILTNGNPRFQYRTSAPDMPPLLVETASLTNVADASWHHLVGVRDVHKSEQRLYVDGVLAVSDPLSAAELAPLSNVDGSPDPITIGAGRISGQEALNGYFRGAVDEVAIYFSALDDAEVAAIHDAVDGICR